MPQVRSANAEFAPVPALRAAGVDPAACQQAAGLLGPVAAAADPTGRPLFAANVAVRPPDDPVGELWQLTTTLREHRGDGHIAAMVTEGITGLQAHLLQVADGRFPEALIRQAQLGRFFAEGRSRQHGQVEHLQVAAERVVVEVVQPAPHRRGVIAR